MSDHKHFDDIFGDEKYSDVINLVNDVTKAVNNLAGINPLQAQVDAAPKQSKKKRKNTGKIFEALIKESCKIQMIMCDRLQDAGYTGQNESGKRFTIRNHCDFILYDGWKQVHMEAKSRQSSLRFDEITQYGAMKRKRKQMIDYNLQESMMIGVLVYFQKADEIWWIDFGDLQAIEFLGDGKKSFNANDLGFFPKHGLQSPFQVGTFLPTPRSKKKRIDIRGMMGKSIDPDTVQLEEA